MKTHIARCQYLDSGHIKHFSFNEIGDAVNFAKEHISINGLSDVDDNVKTNTSTSISDVTRQAIKMSKLMANHCPGLGLVVAEHCNLHCAHCVAAAPLVVNKQCASPDEFDATLNQLHVLCGDEHAPLFVHLFGGEPTLHPQLSNVVAAVRKHFPTIAMRLDTNGTLLQKLSNDTLTALQMNKCDVAISVYSAATVFTRIKYSFTPKALTNTWCDHKPTTVCVTCDDVDGHLTVSNHSTMLFPNGDLLFCSYMYAPYTMQKHKLISDILVDGYDYVNVHHLLSFADVESFFSKMHAPFCSHCRLREAPYEQWHQSLTCSVSDWFEQ